MAKPGPNNTIADVPGLKVGQAQDEHVRTGVTVILPDDRAVCSVDVRGGGPGTRETDALQPHTLVDAVDALVLSGGSSYGLAAADGVAGVLGAQRRGFELMSSPDVPVSPIVPAAILYDLANGGDKHWGELPPYASLGRAAVQAASGAVTLGRAGAGYGASAGTLPGGIGSASIQTGDGYTIGAIVAVNCFGAVKVPGTEAFWAAPFEIGGEFGGVPISADGAFDAENWGAAKLNPAPGTNTTIAVIATDAVLTSAEAKRLAQMASAGFARAIRPVFTPFDGDVVFALSTGQRALAEPTALTLSRLGSLAADCLTRAVARGVFEAAKV
ncbi:P1 family peptidase [Hyphobacterium sp. CCMP332]|uniref:P1 family peptidase n=1 Tax=Hyphobacterium sp. CCMP332 TaxID=2749086 RepID=UPI00164F059E|nr:P1 family peptidase [Hyphobacterium sp. CCMP332]QNL19418.1 P1 family peptidase [Hyphobacterium sp. CCMP332]